MHALVSIPLHPLAACTPIRLPSSCPSYVSLPPAGPAASTHAAGAACFDRTHLPTRAAPVITFGGSLAGTLAALMRLRYPQIVDMAYSSSAPLYGYPGLTDQFAW